MNSRDRWLYREPPRLTNSFTTARLRAEQDALDEIEDLRDEAIDAEMDRQRAIDNLRDDALETEQDRRCKPSPT